MKKVDIWIIVAAVMAVVVNPDESNLFGIAILWGNLIAAICVKAIIEENKRNKKNNGET